MPEKIDTTLLKRLINSPAPESPRDVRDRDITGFIARVLPSGRTCFYAQVARSKRELICHHQGSGRAFEGGRAVFATDILDRKRKEITLGWLRKECKRLQGKVIDGEDFAEQRRVTRSIPTLRQYIENTYAPWVIENRRSGSQTLARIRTCFFDTFGNLRLDQITPEKMDLWRTKALRRLKPETVNRDVTRIKSALNRAKKWRILSENPLAGYEQVEVDRNKRELRALSVDEERSLRAALMRRDERLRRSRASGNMWRAQRGYELRPNLDRHYPDCVTPAVIVSLETGVRKSELFSLEWQNLDLDEGVLIVAGETAKSYETREIPLNTTALSVLRRWKMQQGRPERGFVFPGMRGKLTTLRKSFQRVIEDAGIERSTPKGRMSWHSLRHTFGTRLGAARVDPATLKDLMGHSDLRTTQKYLHTEAERKRAAVDALAT